MTTALAPGASPEALAPGDPDGARALAARLEGYAEGAGAAAARLRALESGTWVGEAADAFRASLEDLPQRLRRAGEDAPDESGFWDQAFRLGKEFVGGAVEATVGLGEFAFELRPPFAPRPGLRPTGCG